MGFVYNNTWEAFCRTYLELNGFFVLSNLFLGLMVEETGEHGLHYKVDADLVAHKLVSTELGEYVVGQPGPNGEVHEGEFFAGATGSDPLVYCEVKANFRKHGSQSEITQMLSNERSRIEDKAWHIARRFHACPRIVLMAYQITPENKDRVVENEWSFKEFPAMYRFMRGRFSQHSVEKSRVPYNDPWLEVMRFLECLDRDGDPAGR